MNANMPSASALLKTVLTASDNGLIVYQPVRDTVGTLTDLRPMMLNPVAERHIKHPALEVIGKPFSQLFPRANDNSLLEQYRRVAETGQPARFECQHAEPGQLTPVWFDVSAVRVNDTLVVSYTDISQAKADAEAARQANLMERAFDASVSGITVYEAIRDEQGQIDDFRFVMINKSGLRMSGYTREQLIGHSVYHIYPATKLNGLFNQYVQVCETGQPFSGEHYYPEYDVWRDLTIVPVQGGIMLTYIDITARKKSEEAVRHQTELLQGVLEGVPVGIAVLKAVRNQGSAGNQVVDFRITQMNTVLRTVFCPDIPDVDGQLLTAVFNRASVSGLLSRCVLSVQLGESQEYDMTYAVNGLPHWYRVSIASTGEQIILALTDITSTKVAQLAHHFQAELLQKIRDTTPAGLVLWEAVRDDTPQRTILDFRYTMTNRTNTFVTGYSEEYLVGKNLLETFPRFRDTELETLLREVTETGRSQRMIFTYYTERPDGWFDAQFVRKGDGVLMTFMDVSEQRQAQITQKTQSDTFDAVLHSMMHGMTVFRAVRDETGQLLDLQYEHISEQLVRDTGLSRQQFLDGTILTLFPGTEQSRFWQAYIQVLETGEDQQFEHHYHDEGYVHHVIFQVSRIDKNRLVSTYQVINELKRKQQALEVANMELRRSNDNLQQFAYIASHDLQEPLRKIQSFGDMLVTCYADALDESGRDMIARMQKSAERMSNLIRDLLNYSRISTQRAPFEPVSLNKLLSDSLDDLLVAVRESGATVEWGDLPIVSGDQMQLRQLFQNLLSNAVKYGVSGIPPRISVTHRVLASTALPSSVVSTAKAVLTTDDGKPIDRFYEINVADNGIGFDETYLDRIFQVFQRLHGKNEYIGTGVGLAICRKVVENHRGAITASSQPGAGATFSVYLPIVY